MSVKSPLLKKFQFRQPVSGQLIHRVQTDVTEFCLRMEQLQEQMDAWLIGTGLNVAKHTVSVNDFLVEGGGFDVSGVVLRYDDRAVWFMPVFLYGPGVTGGVEITLHAGDCMTHLGYLFMRPEHSGDWSFTPPGSPFLAGRYFDEGTFFGLILSLLP